MRRVEISGVELFVFADRTVDFRIIDDPEGEAPFVEGRLREVLDGEVEVTSCFSADSSDKRLRVYEELRECDYGVPAI